MKCARFRLQERSKGKLKAELPVRNRKPRRYCQKRMVNPEHEEDPRWMNLWDRFYCNNGEKIQDSPETVRKQQDMTNLVLTVQTLKFEGYTDQIIRPRTSFKYKKFTGGNKHRMFVKQAIKDNEYSDEDRSSQLTCYYFDDYITYLFNNDRSRPASAKSTILMRGNNFNENKDLKEETFLMEENEIFRAFEPKIKSLTKGHKQKEVNHKKKDVAIENTKIINQKPTERKGLTTSRNQSPETVEVIRVDVICHQSNDSTSSHSLDAENEDNSPESSTLKYKNLNIKSNNFSNKYLLANSIKTQEENLSGGSKVTLFCKTFKLSNRLSKTSENLNTVQDKKHNNKKIKHTKL